MLLSLALQFTCPYRFFFKHSHQTPHWNSRKSWPCANRRRPCHVRVRHGCANRCCTSSSWAACCSRAIDQFLVGRAGDPHVIVVSADVDREAIETFKAARGHDPNNEELAALRRVWLDNEILYREGLAMQVDKGDQAIRERVIFKALSVIDSNVKVLQRPTTRFFVPGSRAHRAKYDEPGRYDFEEAALSGTNAEAAVRAFVEALNAGTPGDAKAGLRVFKGRPQSNVVQSYGAEFAKALVAIEAGDLAGPARRTTVGAPCASIRPRRRSRPCSRPSAAWCFTTGRTPRLPEQRTCRGARADQEIQGGSTRWGQRGPPNDSLSPSRLPMGPDRAPGGDGAGAPGGAGARDVHGRDGGARDRARRVLLAMVGHERQAPDGQRPRAALARAVRGRTERRALRNRGAQGDDGRRRRGEALLGCPG